MPHYVTVDPNKEWQRGIVGWFTRIRGVVISVCADCVAGIVGVLYIHWIVGTLIVVAGVFGAFFLLLIRYYRLKIIKSAQSLHTFFHESRDDICHILEADQRNYRHCLDRFHKETANRIAKYFQDFLGEHTIGCAIRVAESIDGKNAYVTRARSEGLEPARAQRSIPIPIDQGLPSVLLRRETVGAFVVPSIEAAIADGDWMETPNDKLPDIKRVMVAPINGWENTQKVMLGMLYVTSKAIQFQPCHTLPLKAFADFLGHAYPAIMRSPHQPP